MLLSAIYVEALVRVFEQEPPMLYHLEKLLALISTALVPDKAKKEFVLKILKTLSTLYEHYREMNSPLCNALVEVSIPYLNLELETSLALFQRYKCQTS